MPSDNLENGAINNNFEVIDISSLSTFESNRSYSRINAVKNYETRQDNCEKVLK
jgi:hypothetical protein